jgi:uncharacterized protein
MHTAIGQRLNSSPRRLAAATTVAFLVVAADFALVLWNRFPVAMEGRGVLAVIALAINVQLVQGDTASLGLVRPRQGWKYLGGMALLIGLIVGACIVVGWGAWVLSGRELPMHATDPANVGTSFLHMCVIAPVLEETIYRLSLCVPLSACIGPWTAIAVSGVVFAGLHVIYGVASPENLVGGFFLAWVYLKCESIFVPVALHSLGNLAALAAQIGAWYWLSDVV